MCGNGPRGISTFPELRSFYLLNYLKDVTFFGGSEEHYRLCVIFPVIKVFFPRQAAYIFSPGGAGGGKDCLDFILGYYTLPFHVLVEQSFQVQNI